MNMFPGHRPCLLLFMILFAVAFASSGVAGVRPGVEVGVNFSSLSFDDDDEFPIPYWDREWRTSFTGGVTLEVPVRPQLSVMTGLRYVQQGHHVKFDIPVGGRVAGEFTLVQEYLSVPILLALRPFPSKRIFLALGPEFAVLTSGTSRTEIAIPVEFTYTNYIKASLESTNLCLDAVAGYEFPVERHVGVVSLRYTHGLTGVAEEGDWVSDWSTRGLEVLLGMRW